MAFFLRFVVLRSEDKTPSEQWVGRGGQNKNPDRAAECDPDFTAGHTRFRSLKPAAREAA